VNDDLDKITNKKNINNMNNDEVKVHQINKKKEQKDARQAFMDEL